MEDLEQGRSVAKFAFRIHPKTLNPPTPEKALARSLEQRYNFHKKGAFSQLGFRLHRNLRKLILPSNHFTPICC